MTLNVPCDDPAATVTDAGTVAALVFELESVTTVPDGPALPFRLTVPVTDVEEPPSTDAGDTVTDATHAGSKVSVQFLDVESRVAVIVTGVLESTPRVGTLNVAEVAPAAMVTVDGGATLDLLALNATTVPPRGAGAARITVPVG